MVAEVAAANPDLDELYLRNTRGLALLLLVAELVFLEILGIGSMA